VRFDGRRVAFGPAEGGGGDEGAALLAQIGAGNKLRICCAGGAEVIGRVVAKPGGGVVLLDQPVPKDCPASGRLGKVELHSPVSPLLEFHRGTGQYWFSAYANDLEGVSGESLRRRYHTFGKLLALAIVNHCKLSFVFPLVFFRVLLRRQTSFALDDLKGFDSALHLSLKKCLKMRQAQFDALREVEGFHESCTQQEYVQMQVEATLAPAAMTHVRAGFEALAPAAALRDVAAGELRRMLCPEAGQGGRLRVRHVFEVITAEEMAEAPVFVETFWNVVDGLSSEDTRRFLLFVTGTESPPEPGTEQLVIQLPFSAFSADEHAGLLRMLPQAHTCTNTLELPNYHQALLETGAVADEGSAAMKSELKRILEEKLRLAISETGGYELDGGLDPEDRAPVAQPPTRDLGAGQIDLPGSVGAVHEVDCGPRGGGAATAFAPAALPPGVVAGKEVGRVSMSAALEGLAQPALQPGFEPPVSAQVEVPRHGVDDLLSDLEGALLE